MDIQLIAMDLDGTALLDDHRSFSPRLTAALLEAHRRGHCHSACNRAAVCLASSAPSGPSSLGKSGGSVQRRRGTQPGQWAAALLTICARKLLFPLL